MQTESDSWGLLGSYFADLMYTLCYYSLSVFSVCDPNCKNCDTNHDGKCDPGQCKTGWAYNADTQNCEKIACGPSEYWNFANSICTSEILTFDICFTF